MRHVIAMDSWSHGEEVKVGRLPRRVGGIVQPLSDDTAHEFRLVPKPELLIEVPSVARLEPDVLTWHSLCQVFDHPRPDAPATNCGLSPDIKKVGVAHLVGKHSSHADQFAVEPSEHDVLRPLERQPQGVDRATVMNSSTPSLVFAWVQSTRSRSLSITRASGCGTRPLSPRERLPSDRRPSAPRQ